MSSQFSTSNSSQFGFDAAAPRFETQSHKEFFRGKIIDIKKFLPEDFFRTNFDECHRLSKKPGFSTSRIGFAPVVEESDLFNFYHHDQFRKTITQCTSLDVSSCDRSIFQFNPDVFNDVPTCRFVCQMPKTTDFKKAFQQTVAVLIYKNRTHPEFKIRFRQANGLFTTEFNFYEFEQP